LAQKEVERRSLLEERTDRDPAVLVLSAAIDDLRRKIEQVLANTARALEGRRASLTKVLGEYNEQLAGLPGIEKDLAALTRTSDVNANIYKFLLEKHEEARIAKAATVGNIRVIDYAVTPTVPVRPKTKLNLLLGLITGLILAAVVAFVLEYVDDSLKTLSEVERLVGQPIYGVVPRITVEDGQGPSSILVTRTNPKSPISEAFRTLRTNIQFADPDRRLHSLLVTSAGPSEGKSTIVTNLAITLADLAIPTLLIDCDLRKPNLHNLLTAPRDPGLTSVIMGEIPWREAIQPTAVTNLSFLPSGPIPPNPTELLGSRPMREMIEAARQEFPMILLDSPPVVAVTDAALLSSVVDATLLVVEVGRSRAQAVNRAVDLLQNVQARLLGVVANHVAASGFRYDYGYYSYYYSAAEDGERRGSKRRRRR
jgi:tyrosine-protein kinase Etk/Wzc